MAAGNKGVAKEFGEEVGMSDQNGGKTEATPERDPESHPEAASPQNHAPIAVDVEAEEASSALEADPEPKREPGPDASEPAAKDAPRKGGAFLPVAILIGAVALGGGAYYLWDVSGASPPEPPKMAPMAPPAPAPLIPPAAPQTAVPAAPAPKSEHDAEAAKPAPAAHEDAPKEVEAAPPPRAPAPETIAPALAPANAEAEKTIAEMATKLAAAQAAVERLTERLQTVEGQLAAPKNDARATVSARDAGAAEAGAPAARLVVAQSLLSALRQGDDYSAQLAALQNFGVDPARLAPLRAGLSAPAVSQLAASFAALAPKLAVAAAPSNPAEEAKPPQDARGSILGFLSMEAHKLVRIRPAGAPDKDAAATQIDQIEKDLSAGDLAAALSARQQLPAPALALSADWATAAQTRLGAEAAAKAELAQALQALAKTKS